MLGAVIGDFVGSRHEFHPMKTTDFDLVHESCSFTDDTVLTVALADALARGDRDYAGAMRRWGMEHPTSYGPAFWDWLRDPTMGPYGSWANGSAMRVSACAWFATSLHHCLELAEATAAVSHDHPEGIRAARATAAAIYAARSRWSGSAIRNMLQQTFGYDLSRTTDEIRRTAEFELKSWISVPEALTCALEATDFEHTVRLAVSLGADADTQAAIAGSIAEAMHGIPRELRDQVLRRLPPDLLGALRSSAVAARSIAFTPATSADLQRIEPWDPQENEIWRSRNHRARMDAEEARSLDYWDTIAADLEAGRMPSSRKPLWRRLLGG